MSDTRRRLPSGLATGDEGMTLIETLAALSLLLVLMAGLMSVAAVTLKITENQGNLAARTTEYAQDKMEQLLALTYGDTISDTRVFPAAGAGGTGLTAPGGSNNPGAPVVGYVDYLDLSGNILPPAAAPPANWFYMRVWRITSPSVNLKQLEVTATVRWGFGGSMAPVSTVTALKTWPF
jgi:prepilin-type N-terminal cleavage/methylation domain-containing protein